MKRIAALLLGLALLGGCQSTRVDVLGVPLNATEPESGGLSTEETVGVIVVLGALAGLIAYQASQ